MATIRLVPSTYSRSNTNYVTVTDADNMYTNTDSTSYTSIRGRNSSNTSRLYYCYISGFNFSAVPSDANVTGFSVKIKAYRNSYQRTGETYRPKLASTASSGSILSNTTLSSDLTTTSGGTVYTFPTSSISWNTLKSYGSGFTIVIPLNPSSNQYPYVYVYGAEIEVTYTLANSYNVTAMSNVQGISVTPATQSVSEGDDAEITFDIDSISGYVVTDNDVDVTSQLVRNSYPTGGTISQTATSYTTGFTGSNMAFYTSQYTQANNFNYAVGHTAESPGSTSSGSGSWTYVKQNNSSTSETGYADFVFDFSSIPANATISSVQVKCYGAIESTSESTAHADITLYSGTTQKGTTQKFTSTSNSTITLSNPGTWTRAELQSAKLRFAVGYYGGHIFGITWSVTYTAPASHYYTYTISNVAAAHVVVLDEEAGAYIPPTEDPTKIYYPITISSINATTDPAAGTTRVEEGSNQTIVITPSDPLLTLALDNGVDITNQLVNNTPNNTYTVTSQVSGASYGFTLNSSTGYYTSNNNGVSNSAAVCRVNFDCEAACTVTFSYINYAKATYDYGIFGRADTALGTTYTADSNTYHSCSASSDNTANVQTLTYELSAGTHFIDIKYRKDSATNSHNDNLQWKITSIEATGASGYYSYTLTDVHQKHSLVFVFGNVSFYYITSSVMGTARLFPDGQMVKLQGDSYRLIIIPDSINSSVTITDNGVNVTSQLEQETAMDENNNTIVNYIYRLDNISANHTLAIKIDGAQTHIYLKESGTWNEYSKVYKKINGQWVEQADPAAVFSTSDNYIRG